MVQRIGDGKNQNIDASTPRTTYVTFSNNNSSSCLLNAHSMLTSSRPYITTPFVCCPLHTPTPTSMNGRDREAHPTNHPLLSTHRRLSRWFVRESQKICDLGYSLTPFFSTHTHDRWGGSQASDFLASLSLSLSFSALLLQLCDAIWKIVPRIIHGEPTSTPPTRFSRCYSA